MDACSKLACTIARLVKPPLVIALNGTLGAGKTRWTQYFAVACGAKADEITSPTYVIVHHYHTMPPIFHLDAFRVADDDEFLELGVEEMFHSDAITIVEWADRVRDCLPDDRLEIRLEVLGENERTAILSGSGPISNDLVNELTLSWCKSTGDYRSDC